MKRLDKLQQLKPLYDELNESLRTCFTEEYMFCLQLHLHDLSISGWLKGRDGIQSCMFKLRNSELVVVNIHEVSQQDIDNMTTILNNWIKEIK